MTSISLRPVADRPREKLLRQGSVMLSDAELLAAFLSSGQGRKCAYTMACALLTRFGSLRGIAEAGKSDFMQVAGMGAVRYVQFQAAREIFRRQLAEPLAKDNVFHCADDVSAFLRASLRNCPQERFGVLLLDSQHQLIEFKILFTGTVNSAAVYPREVVREVIRANAAALILVHNHPSGIADPSEADVALTRDIRSAMALIDVEVLDHIVVGDTLCVSLAQRGLM